MDWLDQFQSSLLDLDEGVSEFRRSSPSLEDACAALARLHTLKAEFAIVYEALASLVSEVMDQVPEFSLPDGSRIEKKSASDRKSWKHQDLAREVARRLDDMSIDLDTGERLLTTQEMIIKMLEFVQPSYWRVKELSKIGITADQFCEVGEPKESIIVRKAK